MERAVAVVELPPPIEAAGATVIDVRRGTDYDADTVKLSVPSSKTSRNLLNGVPGSQKGADVITCCAHGGSISNLVVDTLHAQGVRARFIAGGIEAWKQASGKTVDK